MSTDQSGTAGQIAWLKVLLAFATMIVLGLLYIYVFNPATAGRGEQLLIDLVPNIIAALLTVVVLYFFFQSRGIPVDGDAEADAIAAKVVNALSLSETKHRIPQLASFHDTFRQVEWARLLREHNGQLDIVVFYFDSWIKANTDSLTEFLRKPKTSVRLFVSDPGRDDVTTTVNRLFGEYSKEEVPSKVSRTGERFANILTKAGAASSRLEVYFVPFPLMYSAQCLDSRTLVLSVFEMSRQKQIDSPAFVIDLTKSGHLQQWWAKELDGLLAVATKQKIST